MNLLKPGTNLAVLCGAAMTVAACQTASLEDAAPRVAATATVQTESPAQAPGTPVAAANRTADAQAATGPQAAPQTTGSTVSSLGVVSVIPVPSSAARAPAPKPFVASSAARTGEFPKIGTQPVAATHQMTDAERAAADAQIAELLRARAATPAEKAVYAKRLAELRKLARTHADAAERQIAK